jgi:hypothetical protein
MFPITIMLDQLTLYINDPNDKETNNMQHVHATPFQRFVDQLKEECPDIQTIIDRLDTTNGEHLFKNMNYFIIKGHVQSGKTKFMLCVSLLMLWFDISPVLVLRNLHSDSEQLLQRLDDMKIRYNSFLPFIKVIKSTTKTSTKRTKPALYVCIGNGIAIKKINKIVPTRYICLIDEVDSMDMGHDTSRHQQMTILKQNALATFGVSATILDPLIKEQVVKGNVILLKTSSDYKGIRDIEFVPIESESVFSNRVEDDLTEKQPALIPFLHEFSKRTHMTENGKTYPHILLVNVGSTVAPYVKLQQSLKNDIPSLCTILYNANGITVHVNGETSTRRDTISETLQWLKDEYGAEQVPAIAIFSCILAGRGVSFVSEDFEWHLNTMYLCVSTTCDEAELLQKIRLAGRYKDSIPLQLFTTSATYADILKAYYKQEEILVKTVAQYTNTSEPGEPDTLISDQLQEMTLSKDKFSKRRVMKNGVFPVKKGSNGPNQDEWSSSVYTGMEFAPKEMFEAYGESVPTGPCVLGERIKVVVENEEEEKVNELDELKRLERKMFPSWSKRIGESKIATWMDELAPERIYSRSEMVDLCKQHDIPLQHVVVAKYEKSGSRGYGKILYVQKGMYQLHPYLVEAHNKYFV